MKRWLYSEYQEKYINVDFIESIYVIEEKICIKREDDIMVIEYCKDKESAEKKLHDLIAFLEPF